MLELRNIKKIYLAGAGNVTALKGIDLSFRRAEFVSILGPSGCGKTTMLNIIGGLDRYTSGDLIINGRSTKLFHDRDWDTYRNHSIGFVFQSYHLIPHQSVLQNVELALTISGVKKGERRRRAKEALIQVGLGDQLHKRPNQLSGGQMQRVAIARALVNDPDILLADEPTGALDTETSVQVMEILKKVSATRLVIMVTHNPDLAETYSSRIIRMLDGEILSDSMPLTEEEAAATAREDEEKREQEKKTKKPSMSFGTAFMLSLKNLFTKKGRTILTSFAGSIGIIGIALIYAVSNGMNQFITDTQEEALSSYPLTLEASTVDLTSLMQTFMDSQAQSASHEKDGVYKRGALANIVNSLGELGRKQNDLRSFKTYLEGELAKEDSPLTKAVSGVQYSYGLDLLVYTKGVDGTVVRSDTRELLSNLLKERGGGGMGGMNLLGSSGANRSMQWQELLPARDGSSPVSEQIRKQYDLIYGAWPENYDEILLVVDENNELDDMTLYALGLLKKEDIDQIMDAAANGTALSTEEVKWSYEEVCGREYRIVLGPDCYSKEELSGGYSDLRDTDTGLKYLYDNALPLKITGIIRPNPDANSRMLIGTIGYTAALTRYVIEKAEGAEVIAAQKATPSIDVLTGLPFHANTGLLTEGEKTKELKDYLSALDENAAAAAYVKIRCVPPADYLEQQLAAATEGVDRAAMEQQLAAGMGAQMAVGAEQIAAYLAGMSDGEITDLYRGLAEQQIRGQYAMGVMGSLAGSSPADLTAALQADMENWTEAESARYYDETMTFSDSTYEENLLKMGSVDLEEPVAINLYAASFENKDAITDAIAAYNKGAAEEQVIEYTDYVGLILSSVTTIVNAITYVLIAFVSISLVVSSIMIGVITLISVQERTKEIGILRAIGASKRDVSSMFNAETMIIGFTAGAIGVGVTYLLCILVINPLLHSLTGIGTLSAWLPLSAAGILILISVALTLIAGIIPSRSAAKKDPVVALRTE